MAPTEGYYFKEYLPLVSEVEQFQQALHKRPRRSFRVNKLKTSPAEIKEYFSNLNLKVEQSSFFDELFYWDDNSRRVSETFLYWAGHYYIQDPVSLLPVAALGLSKGEKVLDLCAAPGGKALYMAEIVGDKGCVVANDPAGRRRQVLQGNIQQLGAANLAVTGYDGRSVPEDKKFKAILVDAPCTGEGAQRYPEGPPEREEPEKRREISKRQFELLAKAYRLLASGGRIVYSTCTYNPRENEAVVSRLLEQTSAEIVRPELDLPHDPGVASWEELEFDRRLEKMWRCYPHHYGGGGMVFALLRRPEE
ncbi:MAG: RsmB/NOP family class I SAM-dependent RNA methyltransferase [bacterium]